MEGYLGFGTICFMYVSHSFRFSVVSFLSEPGFTRLYDFQDKMPLLQLKMSC